MCKVIRLYRHGETEWNRIGKLQGWLDSPLTEAGRALAEQVQWQPDYVVSSDLGRAMETARLMFPLVEVQTDARLREIYLGDWQGQLIQELKRDVSYQQYEQQPAKSRSEQHESFEVLAARMLDVLTEVAQLPHNKIALVSHGVAIASVNAYLQEQTFANIWGYMPTNGAYLEVDVTALNSIVCSSIG